MYSINGEQGSDQCLFQAQAHIWNHTFGFIKSMTLKCAIELGIPDIIHNHAQPMTLPELLAALPIHPSKAQHVHRLMRILSHSGFFEQQNIGGNQQGYVLTHASHLLLKDNPFSLSLAVLGTLGPRMTEPWEHLSSWFQNDVPSAFEAKNGMSIWAYGAQNPEFGNSLDEGMAKNTRLMAKIVTDKYNEMFKGMCTLVDVGGSTGTMAKGIANAFPHMECTVLDLPHVVAGLEGSMNLKFLGGDMFEAVPPANAILLKCIMHDWSDEECVKILKNCKKAIVSNEAKKGKVIIIDMVVGNSNYKDEKFMETQLFWDMEMMVLQTGKERNEEEWSKLLSSAGFNNYKISPILGLTSLIEVYP